MSINQNLENFNWMAYNISEPGFLIRALHEYSVDCVEAQSKVLGLLQDAVAYDWSEDESVVSVFDTLGEKWGVPYTTPVLMNGNYVKLRNITRVILDRMKKLDLEGKFDPDEEHQFKIMTADGNETGSKITLTFRDILNNVKISLHSSVAFEALLRARDSAVGDKLVIYTNALSEYFSDVSSDLSSTSNYFKNFLTQDLTDNEFIYNVLESIGIKNIIESDETEIVDLTMCDAALYTGASPTSAITVKGAMDTISSSIKVCVSVVGSIFSFIGKTVSSAFSKAKKYINQVAVNPNDIEILDENASPFIDGFYIKDVLAKDITENNVDYALILTDSPVNGDRSSELSSLTGKWIAQDFIFGSLRIYVGGLIISKVEGNYINYYAPVTNSKILFKPRVINYKAVIQAFLASGAERLYDPSFGYLGTLGCTNLRALLNNLSTMRQSIHDITGFEEADLAKGLLASILLYVQLPSCFMYHNVYSTDDSFVRVHFPASDTLGWKLPTVITNEDFVKISSGYPTLEPSTPGESLFNILDEYVSIDYVPFIKTSTSEYEPLKAVPSLRILIEIFKSKLSRILNPFNAYFYPYCTKGVSWLSCGLAIKTDRQNVDAFNNFLEKAIIITFVAVVAVTAILTIKKIAASIFTKRAKKLNQLTEKLSSGQKLTSGEKLQLTRLSKKLTASTIASAGLTSHTLDFSISPNSEVEMLIKLIQG